MAAWGSVLSSAGEGCSPSSSFVLCDVVVNAVIPYPWVRMRGASAILSQYYFYIQLIFCALMTLPHVDSVSPLPPPPHVFMYVGVQGWEGVPDRHGRRRDREGGAYQLLTYFRVFAEKLRVHMWAGRQGI